MCFIGALQSSALHLLSFLGPTLFCINFFSWAEWLRSSLPDLIARPSAWNLCRSLLLDALVQVLVTVPICTMLGSGICLVFSCCYLAAVRFLLQFSSVFVVVAGPFPAPLPRPPYYFHIYISLPLLFLKHTFPMKFLSKDKLHVFSRPEQL